MAEALTPEERTRWVLWSVRNDPDIDKLSGQEDVAEHYILEAIRAAAAQAHAEGRAECAARVAVLERLLSGIRKGHTYPNDIRCEKDRVRLDALGYGDGPNYDSRCGWCRLIDDTLAAGVAGQPSGDANGEP